MNDTNRRVSVALGYFDGLHLAHRAVLDAALAGRDRGLTPVVLLFDAPPAEVLTGRAVPRLLADADRDRLLTNRGFALHKIRFAEIRELPPEAFVREILADRLRAGAVSCGYNYRFGKSGAGDETLLKALCAQYGIAVTVLPELDLGGQPVSSTRIRALVQNGDVEAANALLGRPLLFTAPVFSGDHRGRLLGAPTINQYLPAGFVRPKRGVYVSTVRIGDSLYRGVTNVGSRPTFDGGSERSETYILGFSGDLYGQSVTVGLLRFLRPEMKFESFDALKSQIGKDAEAAAAVTLDPNTEM